jgi:hypothetical protein
MAPQERYVSGRERAWARQNLRVSITRLQHRLANSMAHIRRPRPADEARWDQWRRDIETLTAELAKQEREAPRNSKPEDR